jgi:hypothetical protein
VLCVNQGARFRSFDRRPPAGMSRRLAGVTARIERSREYQHSLKQVLELVDQFQHALDSTQLQQWLALEEALLEHSASLNQQYFRAGVELGRRKHRRRAAALPRVGSGVASYKAASYQAPSYKAGSGEPFPNGELIVALAQLISELAQR